MDDAAGSIHVGHAVAGVPTRTDPGLHLVLVHRSGTTAADLPRFYLYDVSATYDADYLLSFFPSLSCTDVNYLSYLLVG